MKVDSLQSQLSEVAKHGVTRLVLLTKKVYRRGCSKFELVYYQKHLDLLKWREMTGCNSEVVGRKVADVKANMNNLVIRLRQDTFDAYATLLHDVGLSLLVFGSCLWEVIDRGGKELQRGFYEAFCNAADRVQQSFVNVRQQRRLA